ncbi:MAG TPA: UPF0182 family protein [Gemmatimonadales bacterium]|nr:UPF0182 family protein [Gemmatimonadales bacterium]
MTHGARRWALLLAVGVLVVVLVGGRWAAFETAERAWAASVPGGAAYLSARDYARLVSGLLLLAAIAWATGNLLFVYRSIGSMQLSRRLGDLEIVEAVPQPALLASTVGCGLLFGFLLAVGKGDWWMSAALASHGVRFGVADPVLHHDVGYYVSALPWSMRLRGLALAAVLSATGVIGLLYAAIGSLRFQRGVPSASAHARAHLGLLLMLLAATLTWDALLDPAETVAGLHGALGPLALAARLRAAPVVAALGVVATGASAVWALRERPRLLLGAWAALVLAAALGYLAIPGSLGGSGSRTEGPGVDSAATDAVRRLERLAFGVPAPVDRAPPGFGSPEAAVTAVPVWNASRVLAAAQRQRELVGARAEAVAAALSVHSVAGGRATWVVALGPDFAIDLRARSADASPDWAAIHRGPWARAGRPIAAVEDDTTLQFERLAVRDSTTWFGPTFSEFAVVAPDTWPALAREGIPLTDWWRRTAFAWVLQSPALARAETDGVVLLWRRDVPERFRRLAPFAAFDPVIPLVGEGALWWVSYGYIEASEFPLVSALEWEGRAVRYVHPALLGVVNAATGETRLYLAPGADALASAWAALFAPLIQPLTTLPSALRAQLPVPARTFRAAVALIERRRPDTTAWTARPREPFELVAPAGQGGAGGAAGGGGAGDAGEGGGTGGAGEGGDGASAARVWTAQGFEAGTTFVALVAASVEPAGPRLFVWRPAPPARLPPGLVGSPNATAPGVARLWNVGGALFYEQALFTEQLRGDAASGIDSVFLSVGGGRGQGVGPVAALRNLFAAARTPASAADTSLAVRWQRARVLAARADAALAAGDLEAFGRLYAELKELLGLARRRLAPPAGRR